MQSDVVWTNAGCGEIVGEQNIGIDMVVVNMQVLVGMYVEFTLVLLKEFVMLGYVMTV